MAVTIRMQKSQTGPHDQRKKGLHRRSKALCVKRIATAEFDIISVLVARASVLARRWSHYCIITINRNYVPKGATEEPHKGISSLCEIPPETRRKVGNRRSRVETKSSLQILDRLLCMHAMRSI